VTRFSLFIRFAPRGDGKKSGFIGSVTVVPAVRFVEINAGARRRPICIASEV
jgi:hypothetical protein